MSIIAFMSATDINCVSLEAWNELDLALQRALTGTRDPQAACRSRERMDRLREQNRRRVGVQDIAVELVRQSRDSR